MTKTMIIEGMSCMHCKARVEGILNAMDGVTAAVDLDKKTATLELGNPIADDELKSAITNAGYEVISIQ